MQKHLYEKMIPKLKRYQRIVGKDIIENLKKSASHLEGMHIAHINSAYYGGGVAEILDSMVLLMNELGIRTGWRLFKGTPDFFTVTKKFHNALQGGRIHMTNMKKRVYLESNQINSLITHIDDHDAVIVHEDRKSACRERVCHRV